MNSAAKMLLDKTGQDIWHRGEKYADKGVVTFSALNEKSVEAFVKGTKNYTVSLKIISRKIKIKCDCPYFAKNRYICKHIVATAIVWDEKRGFQRPTQLAVDTQSALSPSAHGREIDSLFKNPVIANLDLIRTLPEKTALGGYVRPHSKLPEIPKIISDANIPLTQKDIQKCFSEIKRWSQRKVYDPYFCSGEMIAAFCETLKMVKGRIPSTSLLIIAKILLKAQQFNRILVTELIDDSLGLHQFSESYLDDIYNQIKFLSSSFEDQEKLENLLEQFKINRGIY